EHCQVVLVYDCAWVLFDKARHNMRKDECGKSRGTSNSHFAQCWIGKTFYVFDALLQFIEYDAGTFEQCVTIFGRLDALWAALEQSHADRLVPIRDDFRHGRCCRSQW